MGVSGMDTEDDFRQFVAARQRALMRTAWLLTGDWGKAEDLVQTALVRAWPHWKRAAGEGTPEAYVRRIMINKALDWRRRLWRGEVPTEILPDVGAAVQQDLDTRQVLVNALRRLPPRQRAVLVLRFFDDLSEAATAAAMGCSVGTVKSTTSRALTALRQQPQLADLQLERSAR
jgi:RNA polymerase sigma-70 factor (sigma-E family)